MTNYNSRNSNIELLRIVIMFLILVLHANFKAFGAPQDYSISSLGRSVLEAISIISVNIFVIITGYFGSTFKLKKISALLFQCFFAVVPISLAIYFWGGYDYRDTKELIFSFNFLNYWFILSYVALLTITPFLESGMKSMSQQKLQKTIVTAYLIIGLLCNVPQLDIFGVKAGYSTIWFVVLYLIGGYMRHYPINLSVNKLLGFLCANLIIESFILLRLGFVGGGYNNPFVLMSSIIVFILFAKLKFSSTFVNSIAASTTMVYLINEHPVVSLFYKQQLIYMYENTGSSFSFVVCATILISVYFICSILYDKVRIFIYQALSYIHQKKI